MTATSSDPTIFLADIRRVAKEVAAPHADDVDRNARFPREAIDALREIGALSAYVPQEFGGAGFSTGVIAGACRDLGRACSSTAMVFAMHQLQVAHMFRHTAPEEQWHANYMRQLCAEQRLISSCTSEMGTGGNMARSIAAVVTDADGMCSFEKQAPTVSYAEYADDLLTSLRRGPDAEESDQVMVLTRKEQTELIPTGIWDTLGMRGTCSPGFTVKAQFSPEQIIGQPFGRMMSETIVPVSHLLWANVWLGIGIEAFERGRAFARADARRNPGQTPMAARKLSNVYLDLRLARAEVDSALADFERWDASNERAALSGFDAGLRFNALKLAVSEKVPEVCLAVLDAIGIMAFKNDSPYSVGRLLRDSLSAAVMISNERIHSTNASLIHVAKVD